MVPLLADNIGRSIDSFARPLGNGGVCLDVGCGEQPLRASLEALGFAYSSLDLAQNQSGTVQHIGAIDRSLPTSLANAAFDFIVCTEVLEHVADWTQAFTNLSALLKPGGRLLITCPHIWVPHEEPADFFRPTSWALAHYAKASGLGTLSIERLGDGFDVLGTVLAAVRVTAPKNQPWMWMLAGPLSLLRKLALAVLFMKPMRKILRLPTPLYLSTIAVFEKTASRSA